MSENEPTCTSCGKPFTEHLGLIGVCKLNQALKAECAAKESEIQRVWKNYQAAKCSVMELVAIISHIKPLLPTFAVAEVDKVCEKARGV